MPKIRTFLTYNNEAEDAARFYTSIFPNSKIDKITRTPEGGPSPAGSVLVVEFTLEGEKYIALNGGPQFAKFTEAFSLSVDCKNQEEIDRYYDALLAGGKEVMCGWLVDKFGVSWQVGSHRITELISDKDPERAKRAFQAMMTMKKMIIADVERAAEGAPAGR